MNLKCLLLASAAFLPALSAQRVADNALPPNSNLTVGVYAFEGNGDLPSSSGRIFADAVASDLSVLTPISAVTQSDAGRAAVQVHGQIVDEKGKATVIAKITDAASGRVYGEMVEGGPEISFQDLASQLSMKIAALVLQLRGLPAATWPAGALVSTPALAWKSVEVDGMIQSRRDEIPLSPGLHRIMASYSANDSTTRVEFALSVSPAGRYGIVLRDHAPGQLNAWVVDRGTGLQVTAAINRVWLRGDDVPIVNNATYRLSGPRYGAAVVADQDALYVIGGETAPKRLLTDIVRFDLRTHTSTALTNAVIRRSHFGAVLTGGKIYLFGGQSWNSMLRSMQIYDLASGKLTDGPAMPEARRSFATGFVRNRIYVTGGSVAELNSVPDVVYFDLAQQTWKSGPDLPHKASGPGVTIGERILFPGGFDGAAPRHDDSRDVSAMQEFDSRTDRWTLLPPLHGTTAASSLGVLDGRLFMLDGFFEPADSIAYDLATGRSVYFRLEQEGDRESVATVVGDRMYVVGGASPSARALPSASVRVYEVNPNWKSTAGVGGPIKPRPVAMP